MAIIFNLPDNYDYKAYQNHIFNNTLHFGTGERDAYGNITIAGKITAGSFVGTGAVNPVQMNNGDLNTYITPGQYYYPSNRSFINGPGDGTSFNFCGILNVYRAVSEDQYVIQVLNSYDGFMYTRRLYALDPATTNSTEWVRILDEKTHVENTDIHLTENDREILSKSLPVKHTITLSPSGWTENSQMVTIEGIVANEGEQLITVIPASTSASLYRQCEVYVVQQYENELEFECTTVPQQSLTIYVTVQEIANGQA